MKRITGGLILWALLGTAAFGHSFDVAFVVPAGAHVQAMQAFLLASGERDGHAFEESDGHLGSLDVYISVVEMDADVAALRERLAAAGFLDSTYPNNHPHRKRVYFNDMDGNDWEFVQYLSDDPIERNDYELSD